MFFLEATTGQFVQKPLLDLLLENLPSTLGCLDSAPATILTSARLLTRCPANALNDVLATKRRIE